MRLPVLGTPTIASDGTVYLALLNQSTVLAMHPNGSVQWTLVSGKGGAVHCRAGVAFKPTRKASHRCLRWSEALGFWDCV